MSKLWTWWESFLPGQKTYYGIAAAIVVWVLQSQFEIEVPSPVITFIEAWLGFSITAKVNGLKALVK